MSRRAEILKIFLLGIIELEIVIVVVGPLLAMCSAPVDTKGGNPCSHRSPMSSMERFSAAEADAGPELRSGIAPGARREP
jgi:hypothetical protein